LASTRESTTILSNPLKFIEMRGLWRGSKVEQSSFIMALEKIKARETLENPSKTNSLQTEKIKTELER
jgi:hypothetical protein